MDDKLLKELEDQVARLSQGLSEDDTAHQVELFIIENSLDDRGQTSLRSAPREVQKAVLARGNLIDSVANPTPTNISFALLGRVREAQTALARSKGKGKAAASKGGGTSLIAQALSNRKPSPMAAAVAPPDPMELQAFIMENGIDDKAGEALMAAPPAAQHAILQRGNFVAVENASSALIGRLRDISMAEAAARRGAATHQMAFGMAKGMGGGRKGADSEVSGLVEDFIQGYALDDRASEALRAADPAIQYAVLEKGSVSDCQNPSSAVLGRIREATELGATASQMQMQMQPTGKGCGGGGGKSSASGMGNQSDYMALVRQMCSNANAGGQEMGQLVSMIANAAGKSAGVKGQIEPPSSATGWSQADVAMAQLMEGGSIPFAPSIGSSRRAARKIGAVPTNQEPIDLEMWLLENEIDEKASAAIRKENHEVQQLVLEEGDVKNCRNPSSVVMARIKEAKLFGGPEAQVLPRASQEDVEMFVLENALDDRSAEAVRSCAPEIQRIVIDRGSTAGTSNPSSAVQGRIRDALKQAGGPSPPGMVMSNSQLVNLFFGAQNQGGATPEVQQFIRDNCVDDRVGSALISAPAAVQKAVLARGHLTNCNNNPSSIVLARIREATASLGLNTNQYGLPGGPKPVGRGASWGGGLLGGVHSAGHKPPQRQATPPPGAEGALADFIRRNNLDEKATGDLMNESPEVQRAVMARGDLIGTRNPSSALAGRLRDARKGAVQGHSSGPGLGEKGGSRFSPY